MFFNDGKNIFVTQNTNVKKVKSKKQKVECELLGLTTLRVCLQKHIKDFYPPKTPGDIPIDIWEKVKSKRPKLEHIITKDNWEAEIITDDGRGGFAEKYVLRINIVRKNKKMLEAIVNNKISISCKYPSKYGLMDLGGRLDEINDTATAFKKKKRAITVIVLLRLTHCVPQ